MKSKISIEFLTGIVFFAAVSILVYYTVLAGKKTIMPENTWQMTVYFEDALGLQKESKVMVNGVYSGNVSAISLNDNLVQVDFAMFNRFSLYADYRIYVANESAIGGKQVRIYPGGKEDKNGKISEFIASDVRLVGNTRDPFDSISNVIDDNRDNIRVTVRNLRSFSEKLNSNQGTISKLLTDDKIANQTSDLLEQIRDTIEDLREQAPVTSFIRAALTAF